MDLFVYFRIQIYSLISLNSFLNKISFSFDFELIASETCELDEILWNCGCILAQKFPSIIATIETLTRFNGDKKIRFIYENEYKCRSNA